MAAGYDISAAFSDSTTQGGNINSPFTVGGGVKIPTWFWYGAILIAGVFLWQKYK